MGSHFFWLRLALSCRVVKRLEFDYKGLIGAVVQQELADLLQLLPGGWLQALELLQEQPLDALDLLKEPFGPAEQVQPLAHDLEVIRCKEQRLP